MIFRAALVLFTSALVGLSSARAAAVATYQRSENFQTAPKNWSHYHKNQFYGYESTGHTGGKGEAGGLFLPKPYYNYYADTYLNGSTTRSTPLSASGRLSLQRISSNPPYTNSTYICHFARGSNGFINTLGISLTGSGENVLCRAILEFSEGTAYLGNSIVLPVVAGSPFLNWTYTWDPSGGTQGFGALIVQVGGPTGPKSTVNLTKISAGLDFSVNSFGLFQPPFVAPNSNSFLKFDIGHLLYTARVGHSPKLKISAPKKITTTSSRIILTGTANATKGNRVTAVRYRVVKDGHPGAYHKAIGTSRWTADIRVPAGASRVEVLAAGDNGLSTLASRRVQRKNP